MSRIRRLDERVLPALAARLRRERPESGLARLDERFAARGPLALVRDLPQVGFLLIGAVFLAGTAVAAVRHSDTSADGGGQDAVDQPGASPVVLGPATGDQVAAYAARSATSVAQVKGERLALVSFADYRTPDQTVALLTGATVRRVYLRDPRAGADAVQLPVPVTSLAADLTRAFPQVAAARRAAIPQYGMLAATSTGDPTFAAFYRALAVSAEREAGDFAGRCACVFSAVVSGDAGELRTLQTTPGVRIVQAATSDADLADTEVDLLLPEVKGVVPDNSAAATTTGP